MPITAKQIRKLDKVIANLEKLVGETDKVNPFKILQPLEQSYTYFLKWFLDPKGTHGLKDLPLKMLVSRLWGERKLKGVNLQEVTVDAEVSENQGRIDIKCSSENFLLGIENKIDAPEGAIRGKPQTQRYYEDSIKENRNPLLIFLTPKGKDGPKCKKFQHLTYEKLTDWIESDIKVKDEETKSLINHFCKKWRLNMDEEINDMVGKLEENYQSAMSAIYRYDSNGRTKALKLFLESELRNKYKNWNIEWGASGGRHGVIMWMEKPKKSKIFIWMEDAKYGITIAVGNKRPKYFGEKVSSTDDIEDNFRAILKNVRKAIKFVEGFYSKRK